MATANNNGAITGQAKYSPYGVTAGSIPTIFGYTGHQYDAEIGLYYARARTYMPMLGRFMQVDPVGYKQSLNLYTYGMGNPMAGTDPSGAVFIPLGIAAVKLFIGEITATAFVKAVVEIALSEIIIRGADMLAPGAGTVISAALTIYGIGQSVFAGNAPGKVAEATGNAVVEASIQQPQIGTGDLYYSSGESSQFGLPMESRSGQGISAIATTSRYRSFLENWNVRGADAFAHCTAFCAVSKLGPAAREWSEMLGSSREFYDALFDRYDITSAFDGSYLQHP